MSTPLTLDQAGDRVAALKASVSRKECWSCDCLQGLLTQLELDCPEAAGMIGPLKVSSEDMHGCLGCEPCPPGASFAQYLRWKNGPDAGRAPTKSPGDDDIRETIREAYGTIAAGKRSGCCTSGSSCCGSTNADALARGVGYSSEELAALPEGANMGLSCGNPTAIASLKPGETVLDLGSGGGFDVFVAGQKVGASGKVIGVDMTPEMLVKARRNAVEYRQRTGLDNVEFRLGEIEHLPVADQSVDVVISNCVINLSPEKPQVWREMARVLKRGGRVAVSDIALLQPLPPEVCEMVEALVGCVAGAVEIEETRRMAQEAGLERIAVETHGESIEAMTGSNDGLYHDIAAQLPSGAKPTDYVTSAYVSARKP